MPNTIHPDVDEIQIVQTPPGILENQSALTLATVFPVIYGDPSISCDFAGSAFLLFDLACGQMVFATAKHILVPLYEKRTTDAFVLVPHLDNDKPSRTHVAALRIDGVSVAKHHSDVALIRCDKRTLQKGEQLAYSATAIKVAPAVVDEVTLGLGFARHLVTEDFNFTRDVRASHGVVKELFDAGRGTNELVNFPSFRTSAQYDSGMSGGPIIDQTGKCIGIISDGFDHVKGLPDIGHGTPVACLGELGMELEADDGSNNEWTMLQMVSGKLVSVSPDSWDVTMIFGAGTRLDWTPPNGGNDDSGRTRPAQSSSDIGPPKLIQL